MKKRRFYNHILLSAVAMVLFAACTQEDSIAESYFPENKYPLELTASGIQAITNETQASTRATVDDNWNNVTNIAVQVGTVVKQYSVSSTDGGVTAKLHSEDPFLWKNAEEKKRIIAWHPFTKIYPTDWTVKADQSTAANYQASDLIRADLKDLAFNDRNDPEKNKMIFHHKTAKVVVNLSADDGVALDANTSVKLNNLFGLDKGSTITPYKATVNKHTYLALLKEQTLIAKSSFIQVTTGDGTFLYKLPNAKTFKAGNAYTYNITVKANGIEVTEAISGEWTDGGSEAVTSKTVLVNYTADNVKKGDYIYKDGTISDGGLRQIYSDGTMVCEATKPQPRTIKNNPVVGIVFWTPSETTTESRQTPASLTDDKIMAADHPECTHGLAVALEDISYEEISGVSNYEFIKDFQKSKNFTHERKSNFVSIASGKGATDNINKIYGYQNTIVLRAYNEYCTKNNRKNFIAQNAVGLEEFAANHPAPSHSTGWFIPSLKELHLLCYMDVDDIYSDKLYKPARVATRDVVNSSLLAANGTPFIEGYYRSSSEYAEDCLYVYIVYFSYGSAFQNLKWYSQALKAVCAF